MIYFDLKTHKKQPYNIKKVIYQDRKSKKQASITKSNWRKFSFLASIYLFMQYHIVFLCLIGFFNCNNFHWELLLYSLLHHGTWWEWWSPNPTTSPPMIMRKQGPFGKWFFPDNDSFVENNQPWFVDGAILNCASGSASFILFFFLILFLKEPNLGSVKKIIIIIIIILWFQWPRQPLFLTSIRRWFGWSSNLFGSHPREILFLHIYIHS